MCDQFSKEIQSMLPCYNTKGVMAPHHRDRWIGFGVEGQGSQWLELKSSEQLSYFKGGTGRS